MGDRGGRLIARWGLAGMRRPHGRDPGRGRGGDRPRRVVLPRLHRPGGRHRDRPGSTCSCTGSGWHPRAPATGGFPSSSGRRSGRIPTPGCRLRPTPSSRPTRGAPGWPRNIRTAPADRRRRQHGHGRAPGRRAGRQYARHLRVVEAEIRSGYQTQGGRYDRYWGAKQRALGATVEGPDPTGSSQDQRGGPSAVLLTLG